MVEVDLTQLIRACIAEAEDVGIEEVERKATCSVKNEAGKILLSYDLRTT